MPTWFRRYGWLLALCGATLVTSCRLDAPDVAGLPTARPGSVILREDTVELSVPGELRALHAAVFDAEGSWTRTATFTWQVRDQTLAQLDTAGGDTFLARLSGTQRAELRALGAGDTWVVASAPGYRSDSVRVRIAFPSADHTRVHRFTVAAAVHSEVAQLYAGVETLTPVLVAGLRGASAYYDAAKVGTAIEFVLDTVFIIPPATNPTALQTEPRRAQVLLLWLPPVSNSIANPATQTVFFRRDLSPTYLGELAHELAHLRGVPDEYHIYVAPTADPSGSGGYLLPQSLMHSNGGTWDAVSQFLLRANAGTLPPALPSWTAAEFPSAITYRVVDVNGTPVHGATVELRAFAFRRALAEGVTATGTTGADGRWSPAVNPYARPEAQLPGFRCGDGQCVHNMLVAVTHGRRVNFEWFPVSDLVTWQLRHPGEPFEALVTLPATQLPAAH